MPFVYKIITHLPCLGDENLLVIRKLMVSKSVVSQMGLFKMENSNTQQVTRRFWKIIPFSITNYKISILSVLLAFGLTFTSSLQAATVIWDFNLPATGNPSLDPAYPSVATLMLVDTPDGVQFTLDPNEFNPGYEANSTVDALNIVFTGPADLPSAKYQWDSGPVANTATFGNSHNPLVAVVQGPASAGNMDTGYKSADGQLKLTWDNPDFNVTDISMWTILGTTIADNFSILATQNNKPSPVFGIFSVSPISQFADGPVPNPSNWVTGPSPVPVPAAFWLFGTALIGFVSMSRKLKV